MTTSDPGYGRESFDPGPQRARDAVAPDPNPDTTTGLEPGGGVPPGETPPGESSTTGVSDRQPPVPRTASNWAVYVAIGAVALLVALFGVGHLVGFL
ncbi:DUF6480 family protein [Cellulomonas marina]|uniref:Uncharacterized protein n=1 Tax=Cellulomonas marina TaxID=988821 RepID=A0A1I0YQ55_9CELL|nr:DUF6480 family protein [Cellulomonas marina]GIG27578.1 hypothetical protein Cma02nite_01780 [Cellulomonas marina]SFB15464.1 hypothetical protein SAMN05421867_10897 [Cellulomonas marina]